MNRLLLWLKLARGALTPLVVVPVLLGTAYAVYDAYPMRWTTFVLVLFGGTALFVAAMVIVAILELTLGREPLEEDTDVSGMRGPEVMGAGLVSLPEAAALGAAALAVALACGALLARPAGSFSMGLGFAGLMIAISYAVPGVGLRDLGHGVPELGAFLALGPD